MSCDQHDNHWLKLPFWLSGPRAQSLRRSAETWWKDSLQYFRSPFDWDALNAPLDVVDLLAYERGIERCDYEPEDIYRRRVHYAFINAKDAGTAAGMVAIFERLGVPVEGIDERLEGHDFDEYRVRFGPKNYADNKVWLAKVVQQYARTCRRPLIELRYFDSPAESAIGGAAMRPVALQAYGGRSSYRLSASGERRLAMGAIGGQPIQIGAASGTTETRPWQASATLNNAQGSAARRPVQLMAFSGTTQT